MSHISSINFVFSTISGVAVAETCLANTSATISFSKVLLPDITAEVLRATVDDDTSNSRIFPHLSTNFSPQFMRTVITLEETRDGRRSKLSNNVLTRYFCDILLVGEVKAIYVFASIAFYE